MTEFKPGDILKSIDGNNIKIIRFLASGGQGDVYEVEYKGERKALKWYRTFGTNKKKFYENLKNNISNGSPDKNFLWPEALTTTINNSFGYVMKLRPKEYHELSEFIIARGVKFPSFKAAIEVCLKITSAFRILHNKGYSYQDLNDGNFFINPDTGDVLICDNDNVAPNNTNMGIIGKPRYMAPEIVSGHNKVLPNTQSDRFSLAIILFIILCNNHPLEGKRWVSIPCMTPAFAEQIYGNNALFIYDENDRSNAPVDRLQPNVALRWKYMPDYIKDAFKKSFSREAILNPSKRLRETDWLKVLTRFESEIVKCDCGNEIFIHDASDTKCEKCGRINNVKHKLKLPEYSLTIARGTWLYRCQLGSCNDTEALNPILHSVYVISNGKKVLCLKNEMRKELKAITTSGNVRMVKPNELVPVLTGIKFIVFDKEIEVI